MKLIVFIFMLSLTSCVSSQRECILFDQSYLDFSDHGYINLYFCNEDCCFFKYYDENKNISLSKDNIKEYSKIQKFVQSPKIINNNYYKEIKGLILEILKEEVQEDGMIWVTILDTNENTLKEGTIVQKDFQLLKEKISQLNTEYDIDSKNVNLINWYFETVEKGVVIGNGSD